ncbi:MAG: nuclear transport factor 2 family protein [Candidatus Thermoplasmatota archaeon]
MHPNAELVTRFYGAFQRRDADAMAACYLPDARFSDPVFQDLRGPQVPAMWRMLVGRAQDLEVTVRDITANDTRGLAHWEATYTFGKTGRRVHNKIAASFEFQDGKIARHMDAFDLYAWTRMALGPSGVLLGWTPLVQGRVRRKAAAGLAKFMAGESSGR